MAVIAIHRNTVAANIRLSASDYMLIWRSPPLLAFLQDFSSVKAELHSKTSA